MNELNKNWVDRPQVDTRTCEAKREGEIVIIIHELEKLTDELAAVTGMLCEKMKAVLRPSLQCAPPGEKLEEIPYCTDLGRCLHQYLCGIRRCIIELDDASKRCEL